jgi:hypothetical protein
MKRGKREEGKRGRRGDEEGMKREPKCSVVPKILIVTVVSGERYGRVNERRSERK